ncbi:MAG: GNAT family N-acetyltransferase [Propionibacteriaceae bacterium]
MGEPAPDWRHVRTRRLFLDEPVTDDIDDLYFLHSDARVWTHFPSGRHRTRQQTVDQIEAGHDQWQRHGLGYWSVRESVSGRVIGRGGCAVPTDRPWWNLYYRLSPTMQGRGYASELGAAALEAAHRVDPDRPVIAYLLAHNLASKATAEKVGLHLVWRGPDVENPDPTAERLVYADRLLSADILDEIGAHS